MRADAYNQINQIYQASRKPAAGKTKASKGTDRLEISQVGKDYQIAKQAVAATPDIREDKVASVKARIESGDYDVSAEALAEKLAAKYGTTIF